LVQYPYGRSPVIRQVVPDNMVVVHAKGARAETSFNLPVQPCGPYWVLEYVSKGSKRKDYDDSFRKYERELKVPYYLLFYPDTEDLTLYRRGTRKYVSVKPYKGERYPIDELELELALVDGHEQKRRLGEQEQRLGEQEQRIAEQER